MVKSDFSENLATPKPQIEEIKPPRVFIDAEGARWHTIGFAMVAVAIIALLGLFLGSLPVEEVSIKIGVDDNNAPVMAPIKIVTLSEGSLFSLPCFSLS